MMTIKQIRVIHSNPQKIVESQKPNKKAKATPITATEERAQQSARPPRPLGASATGDRDANMMVMVMMTIYDNNYVLVMIIIIVSYS